MPNSREFAHLIPHAGLMCLLDQVVTFDDDTILCRTGSHRSPENPLKRLNRLSSLTAVEYAAQTMAVHGALLAQRQNHRLPQGVIASLRDAVFHLDRLDDLESDLLIRAHCILTQSHAMVYDCEIQSGTQPVFSGTIGVFFSISGGESS